MKFLYTRHAVQRMSERSLSVELVELAIQTGTVIQVYPDDQPYPSKLVLIILEGKPVHVLYSSEKRGLETIVHVITAYPPNKLEWNETFTKRRS